MDSPTASTDRSDAGSAPDLPGGTIKDPTPSDVLCGRGGSINSHPGNERFRTLVEKRKRVYLTARFKREKRLIASSIVSEIRALDPPGRFLQLDKQSGMWKDIGDEKARDKTSQALRENAPTIRSEIEAEINEHRAELKKEEEKKSQETAHVPPQPHPAYYQGAWGHAYPPAPYGHPGYYPPPPAGHPAPYGHPGYYPPPPAEGQWYGAPPHAGQHMQQQPPQPVQQKSAFEQTADYIASSAESIRKYAEDNLSFAGSVTGGMSVAGSNGSHVSGDMHDMDASVSIGSMSSKPISYVHHDDSKKRRIVKFRSDTKRNMKRRPGTKYPPSSGSSVMSGNSLLEPTQEGQEIEPHDFHQEQDHSLMNQVSTQILSSLGSWDAGSTLCGFDTADDKPPKMPGMNVSSNPTQHQEPEAPYIPEEEMAVEWEGQEVQLMDHSTDYGSVASEDRMPAPPPRAVAADTNNSIAFSSLGSCHSWLPMSENFSAAASYVSGRDSQMDLDRAVAMQGDSSAANSAMMMAADGSIQSIGGASLTRVFEHEPLPDAQPSAPAMGSPNMSHRVLASMPSWERNLRSRSPLSIEEDDEDISLISKSSSKHSTENHIPHMNPAHGMSWEQKE